jgi:hypothetical protein
VWCAFVGAWGVASGYACFILWWEQEHLRQPLRFALAFAGSVGAALVIETVRDLLRHGSVEELRQPTPSKILALLLTASMFELFVLAYHAFATLDTEEWAALRSSILGPALSTSDGVTRDLVTLAVMWLFVGAFVAWRLSSLVFSSREPRLRSVVRGITRGAIAGAIAAPATVFVCMLFVRARLALELFLTRPEAWRAHLDSLLPDLAHPNGIGDLISIAAIGAIRGLSELRRLGMFGLVILVALLAGLVWLGIRAREWRPLALVSLGAAAALAAPLGEDIGRVALLGLLAVSVWLLPGALLGFSTPLLERPSERPAIWIWSGLGFAAALALVILTWLRVTHPAFLVLAGLLAAGGVAFQRGARIEDYWSLVALSLAVVVWSLALGLKELAPTSYAVLDTLHQVNTLPASLVKPPVVKDVWEIDGLLQRQKEETVSHALSGFERLEPSAQVAKLEEQRGRIERLRAARYEHLHALVAGKVEYLVKRAEIRRQPGDDVYGRLPWPASRAAVLDAACRAGVPLSCLDRIDSSHWKDIDRDLDAEHKDAFARLELAYRFVITLGDSTYWSDYARDVSETHAALRDLERAHAELSSGIEARVGAIRDEEGRRERQHRWAEQAHVPQVLELSIAGGFAFWATVGLLATWAMRRHALVEVGADRIPRCFWAHAPDLERVAREVLRRYHDAEHGAVPRDDRELFVRLSIDTYLDGTQFTMRDSLRERLGGLELHVLGGMDAERLAAELGDPGAAAGRRRAALEMIVENARRLVSTYREQAPSAAVGSARLLVDDWAARGRADPGALIQHVRGALQVPATMTLGTTLQGLGLWGHAHFRKCARRGGLRTERRRARVPDVPVSEPDADPSPLTRRF